MNQNFKIFVLLLLFSAFTFVIQGQNSRANLEKKRKELNNQINNTSKLLSSTAKNRQKGVQELSTLQRQVESRSELIKLIREELDSLDENLEQKQLAIQDHAEALAKMKTSYKKVLIQLYRYKSNNSLAYFILSSERFKRDFEKQIYLSRLEKKRSGQAMLIRQVQRAAKLEVQDLEVNRAEKSRLLEEEMEQSGTINKELEEKNKIVRSLKSKENELKKELNKQEKSKKQLNNKIEQLIKDEIAASKSRSRSYENSKKNNSKSSNPQKDKFISTPDYSNSGGSFAAKKGSLPAPVSNGVIVSKFGKQQHPLFDQVFTYNNGIDIRAGSSALVKAVHQGTVVSVFSVPGNGNAVMLKHGSFYTTYSNLDKVSVKRGDEVKGGQQLGNLAKDSDSGNYLLHFELWNAKNKENPELWLRK
jgi:murein hydrolase activator